jgi:uncharacterized SAM-dependent methyltransferase
MSVVMKKPLYRGSKNEPVVITLVKSMTLQEKTDYLQFFTTQQGADMAPYLFFDTIDACCDFYKNCNDYYLCRDEISIINKNGDIFTKYLAGVTDIIEIGPGFEYTVQNKTIPMLHYATDLINYHAIDCSSSYLKTAVNFLKKNVQQIKIHGIKADILSDKIKLEKVGHGKKCVMLLGGTLYNFTDIQQQQAMQRIVEIVDDGILIVYVDTNQDTDSALRAYSNNYWDALFMSILYNFANFTPSFAPYLQSFESRCVFDKDSSLVRGYFVAKEDISFTSRDLGKIVIHKGQELRGVVSRKPTVQSVKDLMSQHNLKVLETLSVSDRTTTFICSKAI